MIGAMLQDWGGLMDRHGKLIGPAALLLLVLAGFSSPLGADMVYRFEPTLELSLVHDGGVFYSDSAEESADELAILRAQLPLVGRSERSTMRLAYTPEAQFYSTYTDLNRVNHQVDLDFDRTFSPRNSWAFGGVYLDTSDSSSERLEGDLVTSRINRQLLGANTTVTIGASERVDLSFSYDLRDLEYDDSAIVGHTVHAAGLAAERHTGLRSSVALEYRFQFFQYTEQDDASTHNLLVRYTVRPSEPASLILTGGYFFQQNHAEGDGGTAAADEGGFIGGLEWTYRGSRLVYAAGLNRGIDASGGIGGSVLSTALRLSVSGRISRKVSIALSAHGQRNEPTFDSQIGAVDILRSSLRIDYELNRYLGLRSFADYVYQQADDVALAPDFSYPRIGLGLIVMRPSRGDS